MAKVSDIALVAGLAGIAYILYRGAGAAAGATSSFFSSASEKIESVKDTITLRDFRDTYSEKVIESREYFDRNPTTDVVSILGKDVPVKVFEPHPNMNPAYDTGRSSKFLDLFGFLVPTQLNWYDKEIWSLPMGSSTSPIQSSVGKVYDLRTAVAGSAGSGGSKGTITLLNTLQKIAPPPVLPVGVPAGNKMNEMDKKLNKDWRKR